MKSIILSLLAAVALLAGCISKPAPSQQFFTLPTSPPSGSMEDLGSLEGRSLGFGPVTVASHLDRAFVAIRLDDTVYEFADSLRWASPVELLIQERLVEGLVWATSAQDVQAFPWASTRPPAVQVSARLVRFEVTPGGSADLSAYWLVRDGTTREVLASGHFVNHQAGDGGSARSAIQALDRALIAFAQELAARIPPP